MTTFRATAGASRLAEPVAAGREAAAQALRHNPEAKLAIVFAAVSLDQARVLQGVREVLGDREIFGSSSFGEIGPAGYQVDSVVVMLWAGEFKFVTGVEPYGGSPRRAAFRVANSCLRKLEGERFDLAMVFCASDEGHGTEVLETIKEVIGEAATVFGGGSGVRPEREETFGPSFQWVGERVVQGGVALMLLTLESKTLKLATTVSHGLQPISNPMTVTRAKGHFVYEVNGENVFTFYEKYLGRPIEEVGTLVRTYPFLVKVNGHEATLPRVPVYIDRANGRIGFFPTASMEGQTVSLAHFTRNEIVRACRESAYNAKVALGDHRPRVMLAVSCGARQMFLGNRVSEEAETLYDVFGRDVPVAGLYSAAEIAPLKELGAATDKAVLGAPPCAHLVGETFCLLVIGDSSAEPRVPELASGGSRPAADSSEAPDRALEALSQENLRLRSQIEQSESLLDVREQVLLKINRENIEVSNELRAVNLSLSEMNQRNLRLHRIIRQYTPRTTWNKAGKLAIEERLEIPDESADMAYLFLDVKGFTSFSETHTPEEVVRSLNEIFQPVTDLLYEHSGDVNKFIGDAIFATFDLPEDAVRAALAICRRVRELDTPFQVRIGVHMGRAVLGNVGSDLRRDNTLIGDAVNLAQRLESNATPGGLTISREVHDSVIGQLKLAGNFREIQVKGKAAPIEVFDVDPGGSEA
ncbi:MAG: FIST C-terminal domain-containing protein [Candidatus Wallbacteria bacterium]|nr:FIST C-terminal domain-containing protein [Candidatus Wallbacteria bacterium]